MYMQHLQPYSKGCTVQDADLLPGEEVATDANLTCMHCQSYKKHLLDAYQHVTSQPTSSFTRPQHMVHQSLQYINDLVQIVGNVIEFGTTQFSVKGKDGLVIVHISFYHCNSQILCTDWHCSKNFINRKNITRHDPYLAYTHIYGHLHTMFIKWDYVKGFLLNFFWQEENDVGMLEPNDPLNDDYANVQANLSGGFNVESGLWEYPALSWHKPHEMMHPNLINFMLQKE